METISVNQIGNCISKALENKNKNVLFIDRTLRYESILQWFDEHPEYKWRRTEPQMNNEVKNGILVKKEGSCVIETKVLNLMNDEKSIWFHHAFSQKSVEFFDEFLDIIKNRYFINNFGDGKTAKHSLEKMGLFVAFTTPPSENDWSDLDEKYYELFDVIYLIAD